MANTRSALCQMLIVVSQMPRFQLPFVNLATHSSIVIGSSLIA